MVTQWKLSERKTYALIIFVVFHDSNIIEKTEYRENNSLNIIFNEFTSKMGESLINSTQKKLLE